jgi:arabinogalactan oligomer/maltooligosaccharide transport system substrate-binding protein
MPLCPIWHGSRHRHAPVDAPEGPDPARQPGWHRPPDRTGNHYVFLEEIDTRMSTSKKRLVALFGAAAIFAAACGGNAATTAPTTAPSTAPSAEAPSTGASEAPSTGASAAPSAAAGEPLSGELTLWHSYGSGGGETGAFQQALGQLLVANKDLKVNVVEQPFSDIFTKWQTDVLAGGGPDLYIAPNDNLYSQADAGALANLNDALNGKLDGFSQVAVDGSKADIGDGKGPQMYMVPESLKAVAMWYDSAKVATPPATTDDLLTAVKGGLKLGLNQNAYHMFGFTGAFGGTLMDDSGKCIADQGGFSDAFKYFQDLKAAGAKYYTDGNALKQDYQTGKLQAVIDGPWQTADFVKNVPTSKVASIPAGTAKANPFTGTDGWYINPNGKNVDLATKFALQMVGTAQEQIMTDNAGHVPAAPNVKIDSPIVQAFSDAAAAGLARPQRAEFNNYWGPFGDAINKVLDKGADPKQAVADACKAMNDANKK